MGLVGLCVAFRRREERPDLYLLESCQSFWQVHIPEGPRIDSPEEAKGRTYEFVQDPLAGSRRIFAFRFHGLRRVKEDLEDLSILHHGQGSAPAFPDSGHCQRIADPMTNALREDCWLGARPRL